MKKKPPVKKAAAAPRNKLGRKPLLDLAAVENIAALQCTIEELAAALKVSKRTIYRYAESEEFREAIERGKSKGLLSLRRAQYQFAMQGDRTMLVWLGKQWLDQKDKQEIQHSGGISVVVERLQAARARLAAIPGGGVSR